MANQFIGDPLALYRAALQIDGAVNLTGIGITFGDACEAIRGIIRQEGGREPPTQRVNEHPVMVLFANKIRDLSGLKVNVDDMPTIEAARKQVEDWKRRLECSACEGTGDGPRKDRDGSPFPCETCGGTGRAH